MPSIDTRKITTQVLVNDGQTVVLGGILRDGATRDGRQGAVPRRPAAGSAVLFRSKPKARQQGRAADLRHAEDPVARALSIY
ncbi:MAG: type II and III secretion system protein [Chromatiales bacterium]|nr:type II and III secretion system protein [Chromatiales bacterium]